MNSENSKQSNGKIIFRIIICLAILLLGFAGLMILKGMKKPPVQVPVKERFLRVEILEVHPETIQTSLTGFGQVTVLDKVPISAELPGRIIAVHPHLEQGMIIQGNEILFQVDPRDYQAAHDTAQADVDRLKSNIQLLKKQIEIDNRRLITIERNRDIAEAEYRRQEKLYREHDISSLSDVEKLEQAYNGAQDQAAQMNRALELYPLQIAEAESALSAAQTRLANARTNLARCKVRAPFTGRITQVHVETGQYLSPGQQVLTLADDSTLEIPISLDSIEARKWLRFLDGNNNGWFNTIEPVTCDIRWTDDETTLWKGILHRIINFDPVTRTLTVAVRVSNRQSSTTKHPGLPLVDGMFCSVSIPGKLLKNVYQVPRWAVDYKNTVYLSVNNRLKTTPVEVAKVQSEQSIISRGLKDGDVVIITRLVEPLENSRLEILNTDTPDTVPPVTSGEDS
ncbi:efflux RND transporter periplasmic adaptor subunit [Thermodesulfobacteriota bacterium]